MELPLGELGVVGIALIVVLQALQLLPRKKNGEHRPTEAQRKLQEEAVKAVVEAVTKGNEKTCRAIQELGQVVATESSVTRDRVFHLYEATTLGLSKVQDLHGWHAPDASGMQTWKGVAALEDEIRAHIRSDDEWHAKLESRLRQVHDEMKKGK